MQKVQISVDLSKVDKKNLSKSKDGRSFLDLFVNIKDDSEITDKDREYNQGGFISQKLLKENAKNPDGSWVQTPIIGNVKRWFGDDVSATPEVDPFGEEESSLPF